MLIPPPRITTEPLFHIPSIHFSWITMYIRNLLHSLYPFRNSEIKVPFLHFSPELILCQCFSHFCPISQFLNTFQLYIHKSPKTAISGFYRVVCWNNPGSKFFIFNSRDKRLTFEHLHCIININRIE